MKVPPASRLLAIFGSLLFMLLFSGCGVFEVGIESTPIPAAFPTLTLPVPISTPSPTTIPYTGRLKAGQPVKVIQIHMLNRTNGWAISQVDTDLTDHILFTHDGGQTWQECTPGEALANQPVEGQSATAFFDADGNAWITFSANAQQQGRPVNQVAHVIWRSRDGGISWQVSQTLDISGIPADFFSVSHLEFLDAQHGWALAHLGMGVNHDYIAVFSTQDGGQTWQRLIDPLKNPELMVCAKTGLAFVTPATAWLTGNCPGLLDGLFYFSSTDSGQSWHPVALNVPTDQPAGIFSRDDAGCGVPTIIYNSARAVLFSVRCLFAVVNRPVTWLYASKENGQPYARRLPVAFGSFSFISPDEGWLVGAQQNDLSAPGGVYHTVDGGFTWEQMIATAWQGTPDFVDSSVGWVIAQSADKLALVQTEDGGRSWAALNPVIGR